MTTPGAVAIVVPARDEEELLPSCLRSVSTAVDELASRHPDIRCRVFVVLDSCRDGSAEVVARHAGVTAVPLQAGAVGAARAAGVEAAASWASTLAADPLWLANTDADTVVPPRWLVDQVGLARSGHDLVVGTVRPTPGDLSPQELDAWWTRHTLKEGHDHVHGANLGFTLRAYRSVGGFLPLRAHEDVELVAAMRATRLPTIATAALGVTTSGRRTARAPDGFAAYLDELGA